MKKFFIFLFILLFIMAGGFTRAAEMADYVNIGAPAGSFFNSDFDVLVMDIEIPDNSGQSDMLEAITVKNNGSAQALRNIEKVAIWVDAGPVGFDGMGVDEFLGYAAQDGYSIWYLSDIYRGVPVGGLRVFVSIETAYSFSTTTTTQFSVPALFDENGNGRFDYGDTGIFVSSENDGPTDEAIVNSASQELHKLSFDYLSPKAVIDNLSDGDSISISSGEVTITGQARDRGGSYPAAVSIGINGQWFEVENTGTYFSAWQYQWFDFGTQSSHEIIVRATDFIGNQFVSAPINVTVVGTGDFTYENSIIETAVSSADIDQTVDVTVHVIDSYGEPVSGVQVDLFSSKAGYDQITAINNITDSDGQAFFAITSGLPGTTLFYAMIGDQLLEWNIGGQSIPVSTVLTISSGAELAGRLVKSTELSTVYLLDEDNIRHAFPNENIYRSWFDDFSRVEVLSAQEIAAYPLSSNVKYKPGSMIKMPSVPRVYMVDQDHNLRWLENQNIAFMLFSSKWASRIDDMSEAFFSDYREGETILEANMSIEVFRSLLP
ncbi:MAG: Ig-like domain-containing protein [Patescibacteria group bacterium]